MRTKLYEIKNKLIGEWEPEVSAVIDTWQNQFITKEQFKEAIVETAVPHIKKNGGIAYIVNSYDATSVFKQDLQQYIEEVVWPLFAQVGIKYFLTISPKDAVAELTVKKYKKTSGPHGITIIEAKSTEDAIQYLKDNT